MARARLALRPPRHAGRRAAGGPPRRRRRRARPLLGGGRRGGRPPAPGDGRPRLAAHRRRPARPAGRGGTGRAGGHADRGGDGRPVRRRPGAARGRPLGGGPARRRAGGRRRDGQAVAAGRVRRAARSGARGSAPTSWPGPWPRTGGRWSTGTTRPPGRSSSATASGRRDTCWPARPARRIAGGVDVRSPPRRAGSARDVGGRAGAGAAPPRDLHGQGPADLAVARAARRRGRGAARRRGDGRAARPGPRRCTTSSAAAWRAAHGIGTFAHRVAPARPPAALCDGRRARPPTWPFGRVAAGS